ncbi:carbohydrate-binding module family 32 protein [Trichoderma novae-zelandiae]
MASLPAAVAIALWAYGGSASADSWLLSTDQFQGNHYQRSPYVANGYFGQRLPAEGVGYWIYRNESTGDYLLNSWPLDQPRATFGTISGFWDVQQNITHPIVPDNLKRGGESVISGIPDWTGLTVTTESGETYKPGVDASTVTDFHQSLSVRDGIVQTNVTWSPLNGSVTYQLNYTVLAHRARLNLGIVRLDLSADQDVRLRITDVLDGAGAVRADFHDKWLEPDSTICTSVKPSGIDYLTAYVVSTVKFESTSKTGPEDLRRASRTRRNGRGNPWISTNSSTISQIWDWGLRRGDVLTIYKFVGVASNSSLAAARDASILAGSTPWDDLISEHRLKWDAIWDDADIVIPSDQDLQRRARASLFHILTNLLPEDTGLADNSISVGGLSSDSYAGLIFWDADLWIYPSILSLHPQYAAGINNYRNRLLSQAVENAQYYNFSGALYPWTSGRFGNCTGTGVCKGYQYHINSDIALAHWHYYQQTNDLRWLAEKGWPVIKRAADMFAAYVVRNTSTGKYETIQLGEPDEFAYNIDNGAFTNVGIKQLLGSWAPSAARRLNVEVPKNWSRIAQNMYIPYDEKEKIIIEFDGMDGAWMTKQASTGLIHYPLQFQLSEEQARNDIAYYSSVNTADGPAMTWSIYAISEAQLQRKGCAAYTYLQRSSESYIRKPFYQFSEAQLDTQPPGVENPAFIFGLNPAFPFLTGAGGFLQVLTHGLTGMRPSADAFYLDPMLPPQLPDGIKVRGMKWQNASFDVFIEMDYTTVTRRRTPSSGTKHVTLTILGGNPGAKEYRLAEGESVVVPTRRPDISHSPQDLALCRPVGSDSECVAGNYPYAIVDGSNSTAWQPATPLEASVIIDIERLQGVSKVLLFWGGVPPSHFRLSGSKEPNSDFKELSPTQKVEISAPYDAQNARIVQIREGNATAVEFRNSVQLRFLKLTIAGSYASNGLGATVAEVQIISKDQGEGYGMNTGDFVSFITDRLCAIFSAAISWSI